jgi:hypothetical protein
MRSYYSHGKNRTVETSIEDFTSSELLKEVILELQADVVASALGRLLDVLLTRDLISRDDFRQIVVGAHDDLPEDAVLIRDE